MTPTSDLTETAERYFAALDMRDQSLLSTVIHPDCLLEIKNKSFEINGADRILDAVLARRRFIGVDRSLAVSCELCGAACALSNAECHLLYGPTRTADQHHHLYGDQHVHSDLMLFRLH